MSGDEYLCAVMDAYVRRRSGALWVAPKDVVTAVDWEVLGIPLHVALRGIKEAFEGTRGPDGLPVVDVRSLSYCWPAVHKEWREWRRSRTGMESMAEGEESDEPGCGEELAELLKKVPEVLTASLSEEVPEVVRERISDAVRGGIDRILERVANGKIADEEQLAGILKRLDNQLVKLLMAGLNREALDEVAAEGARQLSHFGIQGAGPAYSRAFRNLVKGLVRRKYGLSAIGSCGIV
ncbi:hypothetical protein JW905_00425 [bacterium]|nr:hypothetical protein [candidate division CSSED10-310 bacterium]